MIKYLQQRFALTEKGAKDLRKGIACSTLMNLALMLPPTYLFFFLMEYIDAKPSTEPHTLWFYVLVALLLAVLMFFIALRCGVAHSRCRRWCRCCRTVGGL